MTAGRGGRDEIGDDLRFYGADEDTIAEVVGTGTSEAFGVWPENWRTLRIFMRLGAAWEVAVFPHGLAYLGIPPERMESLMRMSRVPPREREAMLDDLQAMEECVRQILNERHG